MGSGHLPVVGEADTMVGVAARVHDKLQSPEQEVGIPLIEMAT